VADENEHALARWLFWGTPCHRLVRSTRFLLGEGEHSGKIFREGLL
jgi:hypothetical protein